MTQVTILILSLCGIVFSFAFFVAIIYTALANEKKYIKIQTAILARMANKQGIGEEELRYLFTREGISALI